MDWNRKEKAKTVIFLNTDYCAATANYFPQMTEVKVV